MKTCSRCQETKSLDSFYKYARKKDGLDYQCKECRKDTHQQSERNNRFRCSLEDCNEPNYAKTYCRNHYEHYKKRGKPGRITRLNSDLSNQMTIYKYNVDPEWYFHALSQGCTVCGDMPQGKKLYIDHDHSCCNFPANHGMMSCGECVRGIVCPSCNVSIGHYENGTIRANNPKLQLIKEYVQYYAKGA